MKNSNSKKRLPLSLLTLIASLAAALAVLSGCASTPEIDSARIDEHGNFIVTYSNGSEKNVGNISAQGDTSITVNQSGGGVAAATAKGLSSAVSIKANFTKKSGGYLPGFGTGSQSYYSMGSGVIYKLDKENADAFIITNYHVVYDSASNTRNGISKDIELYLYGAENGAQAISAVYVGGSMYYDIAVLRVDNAPALRGEAVSAVSVSEKEIAVGDTAIAIGNPEGAGISATLGIISVDSEYISMTASNGTENITSRVIRVDTAVNSGNSGGGLYNSSGELIGIVNAKIVDDSVENIGYAIPSSVAIAAADNIIANCYGKDSETVKRAVLGITLETTASSAVVDDGSGSLRIIETVAVSSVESGSPAYGVLKKGDVLRSVSVGEKTVSITRRHHIIDLMLAVREGDALTITVERAGAPVDLSISIPSSAFISY